MMSEKYIRKDKNSYRIIKNSRVFAKVDTLDDAITYIQENEPKNELFSIECEILK